MGWGFACQPSRFDARHSALQVKRIFIGEVENRSNEFCWVTSPFMRRSFALDGALPHYFLPFIAAVLALASMKDGARAQDGPVYAIAASEGYGVADCLTTRRECGKVVADAWCEAHGYRRATAFGLADDVTASISRASTAAPPKGTVIIRCGE
jgi:hypothetical protein